MAKRKQAKKRVTKKRVTKKRAVKRKPKVLKSVKYQTGKRKSVSADRKRKAMLPGRRRAKSGKKYTETRRNRTDRAGSRL